MMKMKLQTYHQKTLEVKCALEGRGWDSLNLEYLIAGAQFRAIYKFILFYIICVINL